MVALDVDTIFDAALKIQLILEKNISVNFTPSAITFKFPTTRRLAEYLNVPHYYVLPYFAMMEQNTLVTRAERVGIVTTTRGSEKLVGLMNTRYREEAEALLGPVVLRELLQRVEKNS